MLAVAVVEALPVMVQAASAAVAQVAGDPAVPLQLLEM
jgi:hypothetical protein